MIVKFVIPLPGGIEWPICSQKWSMLMTGTQISHQRSFFQVIKTEWIDQKKGILKAICKSISKFHSEYQQKHTIMKVKFYVKQTDGKQIKEKYLFTDFWSMLMTGNKVTHSGTVYQVDTTEWIDQKDGILKAVCLEVPAHEEIKILEHEKTI